MNASQVAKWFIKKNPELSSGYIDGNTKINKLLYFANLFSYAVLNEKMISDEFVAFPNGPVVYSVYRDYRYNGLNRIPSEDIEVDDKFLKILEIVNFVYGNKEKEELVEISHEHNLWKDVKEWIPSNPPIVFENAHEDLIEKCKNIYKAYEIVDFSNLKKEVIGGNVYYYDKENISSIPDDILNELMDKPLNKEAMFIEEIEGEFVLS